MPINVHRLLMFDPLQHGVNHDEAACPANARTERRDGKVCDIIQIPKLPFPGEIYLDGRPSEKGSSLGERVIVSTGG